MKNIEIFEPAMCCSTGLCGVSVDPELLRISTVLNTLKERGIEVKRYNLTNAPMEFVKNGEIVLNISFEATGNLKMDNEMITFKARFGGIAREIEIPVDNVSAIYARENGQGMAFEVDRHERGVRPQRDVEPVDTHEKGPVLAPVASGADVPAENGKTQGDDVPEPPKPGGRPRLTRIK